MENHIKSEKQEICSQNESCKREVTECLQGQVKNLKVTELCRKARKEIRDIKLEIERVYKDIHKKVETVVATLEDHKSSLKLGYKLVNISARFQQIKCADGLNFDAKDWQGE